MAVPPRAASRRRGCGVSSCSPRCQHGLVGARLPSACPTARWPSVTRPTRLLSACRHLLPGEPAECCRLRHCHGPVAHLNPAASLETAQRGVDALPGASGLMRELLLAQIEPDDAVVASGLVEQHL